MVRAHRTMLSVWSPGIVLRAMDVFMQLRKANAKRTEDQRLAAALERQSGGAPLSNEQQHALLHRTSVHDASSFQAQQA